MISKIKEDTKVINAIKSLGIDMVNEAKSGHPGIVLGASPIIYTLFSRHLNINPDDPKWKNRDRFVMSAGHGSALLYATLFLSGFNLKMNDLKQFRQLNSITPGHPEYGMTEGVEATTGPLGQGFANAVGMAIAETYNDSEDHYTYVLASDGDLMEGISYEAASLAGTLKLNKLIVLYDSNDVTLDGKKERSFTENVLGRFASLGWNTIFVKNGESVDKIDKAIKNAKKEYEQPTIIEIKTIIGKGSKQEGTNKVHGSFLVTEDYITLKEKLGYKDKNFDIDDKTKAILENQIKNRIKKIYSKDKEQKEVKLNIDKIKKAMPKDLNKSTRELNGIILNELAKQFPTIIGGSADLSSSNKTYLNDMGDYNFENGKGRNVWYGVREHAMAGITNGLALSGLRPFCSTFLVFSDYMRPAIRLAAIQKLPVIYIFTHDSIDIGEDGPTHEPIEQISTLRAIPNVNVYRPADANELLGVWESVIETKDSPSVIILGRNETKLLENSSIEETKKGGYILQKEKGKLKAIIISTGSDLEKALYISKNIEGIRFVSMPSINLFNKQAEKYKNEVLPKNTKIITIEAGIKNDWREFTNDENIISIDKFGSSGKKDDILKKYNFDEESLLKQVKKMIK